MKISIRGTRRRLPALLTAVLTAFGMCAVPVSAEGYTDTAGHWGASVIDRWSGYDVLHGDGDGTFAPDRDMSVAELSTVLANAFGYTDTGNASVASSVPSWAAADVRRAVAAGALGQDETGLTLTRELAAKIIAGAFGVVPEAGATAFMDDASVSAAYRPFVKALGALGVFEGDTSRSFMPNKGFTRAEVMQVLDNAVTGIVTESGPATSEKSIIVAKPGVALSAGTVKGDVIIGQGVGDGDVTLTDVDIKGRLIIAGGGSGSVHIRGKSSVPNIITAKTFGQPVRVAVESAEASVGTVTVSADSRATVETTNGAKVERIAVQPKTEVTASGEIVAAAGTGSTELTVAATASEVSVGAAGAKVELASTARVDKLSVGGENVSVNVGSGATVREATVAASGVTLAGAGSVTSVNVTAESSGGVTVTVPGARISNNSTAAVSAGEGKTVGAGSTGSVAGGTVSGGSSSGGTGGNTVTNYTVTFDPNGGTGGPAEAQTVANNGTATEPKGADIPTRAGYEFRGWSPAGDSTVLYNFSTPVTGSITLYAVWAKISYTVTFDSNGGSTVAAQNVGHGDKATEPTPAPTKTGHAFGGWYRDAALTAGYSFNDAVTGNLTLYAKWTPDLTKGQETKFESGTEKLVLTFADEVTTSAAIADSFEWTDETTASLKSGESTVATLTLDENAKGATVVPQNIGATEIPALTFTSAINGTEVIIDATTLYKATATLSRPTTDTTIVKVVEAYIGGSKYGFASLKTESNSNFPEAGTWYYFDKDSNTDKITGDIWPTVYAIYYANRPNAAKSYSPGAVIPFDADISKAILDAFKYNIAVDSKDDIVKLIKLADMDKDGNATKKLVVDLGIPNQENKGIADFETGIATDAELGTVSGNYENTVIAVNSGAYLNIDSEQESTVGELGKNAKFLNGQVRVLEGGKARDSAYKGWPLSNNTDGSSINVEWGGYLAVWPGDHDGSGKDRPTDADGECTNCEDCAECEDCEDCADCAECEDCTECEDCENCTDCKESKTHAMDGWLIAPDKTANAFATWDTLDADGKGKGGVLEVIQYSLRLSGSATVKKSLGLIYSVYLTETANLTIDIATGDSGFELIPPVCKDCNDCTDCANCDDCGTCTDCGTCADCAECDDCKGYCCGLTIHALASHGKDGTSQDDQNTYGLLGNAIITNTGSNLISSATIKLKQGNSIFGFGVGGVFGTGTDSPTLLTADSTTGDITLKAVKQDTTTSKTYYKFITPNHSAGSPWPPDPSMADAWEVTYGTPAQSGGGGE
jgi:uncharacterized repeat protein (TIGR02543 family)